jgi:enhancer of mRNA-decapping protein 3
LFYYITELPTVAVDLIVLALAGEQGNQLHQARYRAAAEWANENRAPVLALDPPPTGTPGVDTKFSLVPLLPLAHSLDNGKLYLCNLAFPQHVFREVGIKYNSPFGPKFVIPLHPNDT